MNFLLDTHVFLWFISGDARLPGSWIERIRDPKANVFLSVVSNWEAILKHQLGKLPLPEPPSPYLPIQRERHGIRCLPLDEASVSRLSDLPLLHRDPFDRILIAQALTHKLSIITADAAIFAYPVEVLGRS